MRHPAALLAATLLLGACAAQPLRHAVVAPASAQAISLLGDTLWSLPLDAKDGPQLVERLNEARAEAAKDPDKLLGQLHLAQRTADMGRLREAIGVLAHASAMHPGDPRVFRLRGEYLMRVRELDQAIADLRRAGTAAIAMPGLMESVELAGGGKAVTTVAFQTTFLLGTALYCKGDFAGARIALAEAVRLGVNADDLARAVLWLFFATKRAGPEGEATQLIQSITGSWATSLGYHEHELLLAFKGQLPSDSVRARALRTQGGDERALYSYAIGFVMQVREQREDAELWFEQARAIPNWGALPYLASEAELARSKRK